MLEVCAPSPTEYDVTGNLYLLADKGLNKQDLRNTVSAVLNASDQNISWG